MGSVRLSPQLEETVRRTAAQKGISRSELFRQALESYCSAESAPPARRRFDDVIGVVDVPGDFSVHTRELFGETVEGKIEGKIKDKAPANNTGEASW